MLASLGEMLPRAAARFGDKPALIADGRSLSFAALDRRAAGVAAALVQMGVAPGDRVTLYGPNGWEWLAGYHGALRMGAVINPVNALLTASEVAFIMADCGARALIASPERLAAVRAAGAAPAAAIAFGEAEVDGARAMAALTEAPAAFDPVPVDPDRLSTIGYTSGTTGHPKGAMQSHRAVLLNVAMTAQLHLKSVADTVVSALPCPHVYGNVVCNGALLAGMTLVLHARFDAGEVLASIARHRATLFEGVPTMYMYMLAHPEIGRTELASLTRCTVGGQTMPVATMEEVERRFGCPLLELWGMTELAGLGTTFPSYGPRVLGSIGIALPYCQARIAAVEDPGRTLPAGEVGELMVRGPIVMQGYWGRPEATREAIEPDGWLHSGDLARQDEAGRIFVVDRKKDMINSAGNKLYPAEIERVVAAHPAVAMVAVGARPDPLKGEVAKAYVVLKPGAAADEEAILAHCRAALAPYKVPRSVQLVPDLPKTSTGKILRRELHRLEP
ncbi:MAG: AMP-binding protein [Dongiaceae bacterium]